MTTTTTTEIPLNKLIPFAGNVRKTHNKAFIAELAASIRAHGLQQNLIVKKNGGKYAVVAGGQRLKALLQLVKEGDIKLTYRVPCKIANGDMDAEELSLVENVMRDDMHPADQFEAFRDLVDKGLSVADIAARFGTTETHVRQLLKLARVSPVILKAYREGALTLEQVKAFAVSDDHAAQEQLLASFGPHGRDPRSIRAVLTQHDVCATDRRVKFVGLKAYEKAGGATRADLFTEGAASIFITNSALLDKLAAEKLDRIAKLLARQGWNWTAARLEFGHQEQGDYRRIHPTMRLPAKLAKEADKLNAEYEKLVGEWEEAGDEAECPERLAEIRDRLDQISDSREEEWTPEQLAIAGAVVTIGFDGKADITGGLVRPEDMPKKAKGKPAAGSGEQEGAAAQAPGISAALLENLTAQKSAALAATLAEQPTVALAAVVHAFASRIFLNGHHEDRVLQLAAFPQSLHRVEGSKAAAQMDASREKWRKAIPASAEALWAWCLKQKQSVLLELLAFCAAASVNAVQTGRDNQSDRLQQAAQLAAALKL